MGVLSVTEVDKLLADLECAATIERLGQKVSRRYLQGLCLRAAKVIRREHDTVEDILNQRDNFAESAGEHAIREAEVCLDDCEALAKGEGKP